MLTKFTSRIAILAVAGTVTLGALANVGVARAAGPAKSASVESVSLNYGKIDWVYAAQPRSDGGGATVGR